MTTKEKNTAPKEGREIEPTKEDWNFLIAMTVSLAVNLGIITRIYDDPQLKKLKKQKDRIEKQIKKRHLEVLEELKNEFKRKAEEIKAES